VEGICAPSSFSRPSYRFFVSVDGFRRLVGTFLPRRLSLVAGETATGGAKAWKEPGVPMPVARGERARREKWPKAKQCSDWRRKGQWFEVSHFGFTPCTPLGVRERDLLRPSVPLVGRAELRRERGRRGTRGMPASKGDMGGSPRTSVYASGARAAFFLSALVVAWRPSRARNA